MVIGPIIKGLFLYYQLQDTLHPGTVKSSSDELFRQRVDPKHQVAGF